MARIEVGEYELWLDNLLEENLRSLKYNVLSNDIDGLILLTGNEGLGKTTLAIQMATRLDPRFTIDNIMFDPESFFKRLSEATEADKGRCYILDEAYLSLATANRHEKFQRKLLAILTMIRKKNLFMIVCSPSFFDLSKHIVCRRASCCVYCYGELVDAKDEDGKPVKRLKKGRWRIYDRRTITRLYELGRKNYDMDVVKANIYGVFNRRFPIDKEEYERRKDTAIREIVKALDEPKRAQTEDIPKHERAGAIGMLRFLRDNRMLKAGGITKAQQFLGLSERRVYELLAQGVPSSDSAAFSAPDTLLTTKPGGGAQP